MSHFYDFMLDNLTPLYELGKGTQLCIYEPTRKLYVIKQIDRGSKSFYERIAAINHPHLAKILYVHEEKDYIAVVREYISGDSLSDLLKEKKTINSEAAISIIAQICEGLEALHQIGLVHRDVTPNNIIITSGGNAKIIDFGITRSFQANKSADTMIMGTPGYAAPEQFGFSQSNAQTDIYAVGVLFNVMLTGKLPNEKLAAAPLGSIISKCIEIDSKKRYHSMSELKLAVKNKIVSGNQAERLIKALPGLRSQKTPIVIMAIFLYMLVAIMTFMHFTTINGGITDIFLAIGSYITAAIIPFFCFHNFLGIWDRLPFTAGSSKRTQRIIYYTLGAVSLLFGMILFGSMTPAPTSTSL